VNTVLPYRATVEAAPLNVFPLKLPSGLDSVHDITPVALQYMDERAPTRIRAGIAEMATLGTGTIKTGPGGREVFVPAVSVVCAGRVPEPAVPELLFAVPTPVPVPEVEVAEKETFLYPRSTHRLSKNESGMIGFAELAHGRAVHIFFASV